MLLPSSIQRAEDLVGMAMPTVSLSCANAGPASTTEPSAIADRVDLRKFMFHSQVLSLSRRVVAVCFLAPVRIDACRLICPIAVPADQGGWRLRAWDLVVRSRRPRACQARLPLAVAWPWVGSR